jgi:DNA-binding HxlR family transcriptional regulator
MTGLEAQERTFAIDGLLGETTEPVGEIERCPLTAALNVLGGKWKLIIVYWLAQGMHRFSDLQRRQPSITHKVLTESLRQLEEDGLVTRKAYAEVPPRVEYRLTDYGQTALPLVDQMRRWGNLHLERR